MPSKVEILSIEELEKMHTGSLMSRRKALLKCEESLESSDRENYLPKKGIIEFKDSTEWHQAYNALKAILAARENVPNKSERKAIRQAKAKESR